MDEKVFDRIEKKYLITELQKQQILKVVEKNMEKDGYFESKILNVYFDTDNNDLIVQSIEQPVFKEKLRARSYDGYDKVFLEIKTKLAGDGIEFARDQKIGYKRRVLITKKDYLEFLKGKSAVELAAREVEKNTDAQIASEIDYLVQHFELKPKFMVMYARESYRGDDGLRLTFDSDLKYRTKDLRFRRSKNDKIYFEDEKNIIMEIKAHGAMPIWLVRALSKNQIYPQTFSKIGKIYQKIRKEQNV